MLAWFNKQNRFVKILLLLIPFVNWVFEIGCRFEVCNKTKKPLHIFLFIFVIITVMAFGWIDLICVIFTNHLIAAE